MLCLEIIILEYVWLLTNVLLINMEIPIRHIAKVLALMLTNMVTILLVFVKPHVVILLFDKILQEFVLKLVHPITQIMHLESPNLGII